jgi:hypothetical protein
VGSLNGRNGRWDGNGGRLGFRRFYRGVLHNFKQIGKMEMEMVAKVTGGLGVLCHYRKEKSTKSFERKICAEARGRGGTISRMFAAKGYRKTNNLSCGVKKCTVVLQQCSPFPEH